MKQPPVQRLTVWIDMDHPPHVPLFIPIVRELERRGHRILLTARDESEVCRLADYHKLSYKTVGRHYGVNKLLKILGTLWRIMQLARVILAERPHLSLSHGSRALIVLSSILRIPTIALFDYEYTSPIPLFKAEIGLAPRAIHVPHMAKSFRGGLRPYDGLKEDVYVPFFTPDPGILKVLNLSDDDIVVTIRPPATAAHYHNPQSEELFHHVVEHLGRTPGVRMVILPRYEGVQRDLVYATWPQWCDQGRIIVPRCALDGLNLIWHSDLVISGGGTMNREAAALGVPVYSIFRGPLGAVDRHLAQEGRLTMLETVDDVKVKVQPVKRTRATAPDVRIRPALGQILGAIEEVMEVTCRGRHHRGFVAAAPSADLQNP